MGRTVDKRARDEAQLVCKGCNPSRVQDAKWNLNQNTTRSHTLLLCIVNVYMRERKAGKWDTHGRASRGEGRGARASIAVPDVARGRGDRHQLLATRLLDPASPRQPLVRTSRVSSYRKWHAEFTTWPRVTFVHSYHRAKWYREISDV